MQMNEYCGLLYCLTELLVIKKQIKPLILAKLETLPLSANKLFKIVTYKQFFYKSYISNNRNR